MACGRVGRMTNKPRRVQSKIMETVKMYNRKVKTVEVDAYISASAMTFSSDLTEQNLLNYIAFTIK